MEEFSTPAGLKSGLESASFEPENRGADAQKTTKETKAEGFGEESAVPGIVPVGMFQPIDSSFSSLPSVNSFRSSG